MSSSNNDRLGVRRSLIDERALLDAVENKTLASLPTAELVRRLGVAASVAGALLIVLGGAAMLGWLLDLPWLYRLSTETASTKFATALCLTALGAALVVGRNDDRSARRWVALLTFIPGFLATVTISAYTLRVDSPFDNILGLDSGFADRDPAGRMSLATATAVLLIVIAMALVARDHVLAGQLLATASMVVAAITVLGYVYGAESLYSLGPYRSTALRTAIGLLLASAGVLLRRSDAGYMSLLSGNTAGGIIVRRFVPVAALVPPLGGAFVVHLADVPEGSNLAAFAAVVATLVGVIGAALVWIQSAGLRDVDLRRAGAEDAFALAREAITVRDALAAELAASEQRARAIVAGSSAAYISFDAGGIVRDFNAAALRLFGLPADKVLGVRADTLVKRSKVDNRRSAMMAYLAGEGPPPGDQRYEAEMIATDGRRFTVDISLWTVVDDSGPSFHAFISDITDRKHAETELRRANEDLADFSAAMAHDLRTPLTVVKGFASMLRSRIDGDEEAEWVRRIEGAADRGARLIDDILAYAQVGHTALIHAPVDLDMVARRVAEDQASASERVAEVTVKELPRVFGDERLLETLLSNLVGNALKYVPPDRDPHVLIDAVEEDETGWPVIRVSDNGDPLDDSDRLFEMFQRGAADDRAVGSGVGLAVCRRVAELHDGRVWLETSEQGGPRFCVLLSGAPDVFVAAH